MNVDDDLEDIRWIRGLGDETLPTASYALLPNLKKGLLFAIGEWSRFLVVCFLLTSDQVFGYHTPRRRPPRITGRVVNTATRGWVGATNERAPFRFHDAVVGLSIDVCQGRGISPRRMKHLTAFSHTDLSPTSGQECFFSFLLSL